jgi:alpha-tubulin suppressor-like RCC1 family protein
MAPLACNALLGITDVTLGTDGGARNGDGSTTGDDGQVGGDDGSGILDTAPLPDGNVDRIQIATLDKATCARRTDGTVYCWGDDTWGAIGTGVAFDGGSRPSILNPSRVMSLDDATQISGGADHVCALRLGGTAVCWGSDTYGQLGNGKSGDNQAAVTPLPVANLSGLSQISAGGIFTCALKTSGEVTCWGDNVFGELGNGDDAGAVTAQPVAVSGVNDATQIATGYDHVCALRAGGTVVCWGSNADGELGNASTNPSTTPVPVSSLNGVKMVAAGDVFSCAVLDTGAVACWGSNRYGQLGNGAPSNTPNPTPVTVSNIDDAVAVTCGDWHACALRKTGQIACWGYNAHGQLGYGVIPADAEAPTPTPTTVLSITAGVSVSAAGEHSCATTADSHVLCWGQNADGEIGDGTTTQALSPQSPQGF